MMRIFSTHSLHVEAMRIIAGRAEFKVASALDADTSRVKRRTPIS